MPLDRLAWIVTVAASMLLGVLLLVSGYTGYGLVAFAVAVSAGINLR